MISISILTAIFIEAKDDGCELESCNAPVELNGSVKEPNKVHRYETEKITRKASDAAYRVVWFFHLRSLCTTHLMLFTERRYMRRRA